MTDSNLHKKVAEITSTLIEDYLQYGVTEVSVAALSTLNEAFLGDTQIAAIAAANAKATTSTKNAKRQQVLDSIRAMTLIVYADPAVNDTLLNKAGFSPRPVYGTKTTPKVVTNVSSQAFANGSVTLKWGRNGNSTSTLFTIWAKGSTGSYAAVATTNKVKITMTGFTPGVYKQFYVTSMVNGQTSLPSAETAIYGSGGSGEVNLQIAA